MIVTKKPKPRAIAAPRQPAQANKIRTFIVPAEKIYLKWPWPGDCRCTVVPEANRWYLKFVHKACPHHANVECVPRDA